MKILVSYSSQTQNTKKLADAIFESLSADGEIKPLAEAGEVEGYDVIALGFWFKAGQPDPASQDFLGKLNGKKVFLFATHGAAPGSAHVQNGLAKAVELAQGAKVLGSFSCQGEVAAKFLEMAASKDPQPPWLGDAPAAKGHPNDTDLAALKGMVADLGL